MNVAPIYQVPCLAFFGFFAAIYPLQAQITSQPASEYSNGAMEMTVEHAQDAKGVAQGRHELYGILTIRLKNTTAEPLHIVRGPAVCDFAIEIRDDAGIPPLLTALGERLLPKSAAEREVCPVVGSAFFDLEPGKDFTTSWRINDLFLLSPGRPYTVKVTWVKGMPAKTPSGRAIRGQLSRTPTIK